MSFTTMLTTMLPGVGRTCLLFILTAVLSLILGIFVMFLRQSRIKPVAAVTKIYISVMRGTPLMLQLLVWYFGPFYLFGWSIRGYRFTAILLGFVFNYAAYFAEIYRSGMGSVPVGQNEAAQVLGYSKGQAFIKIILPQVVKRILPAVTNEVITLVKDTSLAFALAYQDVFSLAKQISASQTSFMPFLIAGIFYYIMNYAVAFAMDRCEKALSYYTI